jgi:hypothetical protein
MSVPSFVAFNWFPNNTCQLFYTFPITYKIQSTPQARLYFPKGVFPNASQCCMPDLNSLLNKLTNGTWTYVNISNARNLLLDNNGYLVTVEENLPRLDRFNAENLTLIDQTVISNNINSYAYTVGFSNNAYFAGLGNGTIVVIHSGNLNFLNNINSPYIQNIRGIIFLNNGSTMVSTNIYNNVINFFNQTNDETLNYTFAYQQSVYYPFPHGLTGYNDSFFYATSYQSNSVYSYSAVQNSTLWIEKLVVNTNLFLSNGGGAFVTIDECGRYWFSLETSFIGIFDSLGSWIGNFSLESGMIVDTLITDNYVMYFTDRNASAGRIIRIDPHIQC